MADTGARDSIAGRGRRRCEREYGQHSRRVYIGRSLSALLGWVNVKAGVACAQSREIDDNVAQQASSTIPPELVGYSPEQPTTLREARASRKRSQWQGALKRDVDRYISRGTCKRNLRPKGKTVLGTRLVKKIGKDG